MKNGLIYCLIAIAVFGCNSGKKSYEESSDITLKSTEDTLTAKIIKTADMRFRVKDVQSTKEKLSSVIMAEGGTVSEFSIHSDVQQTEKVKYNADSLLELTSYSTEGLIVAKVPAEKVDDFTNKVAKMAVFVDNQSMKLDDQSITYLSNALKNQNKLEAVDQLNKFATKKNNQVNASLDLKNDYVDKKVENLAINSRIKYSTITLNFYQAKTVKQLIVGNEDLADYRPGFLTRFGLSFQNGWNGFKELLLFMTNLWVLLLVIGAGYFIYRYYYKKLKSME